MPSLPAIKSEASPVHPGISGAVGLALSEYGFRTTALGGDGLSCTVHERSPPGPAISGLAARCHCATEIAINEDAGVAGHSGLQPFRSLNLAWGIVASQWAILAGCSVWLNPLRGKLGISTRHRGRGKAQTSLCTPLTNMGSRLLGWRKRETFQELLSRGLENGAVEAPVYPRRCPGGDEWISFHILPLLNVYCFNFMPATSSLRTWTEVGYV